MKGQARIKGLVGRYGRSGLLNTVITLLNFLSGYWSFDINFPRHVKAQDSFTTGVQTAMPASGSPDGHNCEFKIVSTY